MCLSFIELLAPLSGDEIGIGEEHGNKPSGWDAHPDTLCTQVVGKDLCCWDSDDPHGCDGGNHEKQCVSGTDGQALDDLLEGVDDIEQGDDSQVLDTKGNDLFVVCEQHDDRSCECEEDDGKKDRHKYTEPDTGTDGLSHALRFHGAQVLADKGSQSVSKAGDRGLHEAIDFGCDTECCDGGLSEDVDGGGDDGVTAPVEGCLEARWHTDLQALLEGLAVEFQMSDVGSEMWILDLEHGIGDQERDALCRQGCPGGSLNTKTNESDEDVIQKNVQQGGDHQDDQWHGGVSDSTVDGVRDVVADKEQCCKEGDAKVLDGIAHDGCRNADPAEKGWGHYESEDGQDDGEQHEEAVTGINGLDDLFIVVGSKALGNDNGKSQGDSCEQ